MEEQNEQPKPTVYEAVAEVIRQMPAIGKDHQGPRNQGSYAYRGIEDIKAAAQKLMAAAGVVYAPRARLISVDPEPPNGVPGWQDFTVAFTWIIKGPAGDTYRDDDGKLPRTIGMGRDNSDKGINKAHAQAEKYMLNSLLQIADPSVPEPDALGDYGAQMSDDERASTRAALADPDALWDLTLRVGSLPDEQRGKLKAQWVQLEWPPLLSTTAGKLKTVTALVNAFEAEARKAGADLDARRAEVVAYLVAVAADTPGAAAEGPPDRTDAPEPASGPAPQSQPPADAPTAPEGHAELPDGEAIALPEPLDVSGDAGDWANAGKALGQSMRDEGAPLADNTRTAITAAVWELHHATLDRRLTEANVTGFTGAPIDFRRMLLVWLIFKARRAGNEALADRGEPGL